MRMLALVLLLAANLPLAWGQADSSQGALLEPGGVSEPNHQGPNARLGWLPGRKTIAIVDNAEDAEALERTTQKSKRIWVRAEYLLWWIKSANFPPLVTTGDFAETRPGALDSLSTSVLFGRGGMDFQDRGGGRFSAGWWLDDDQQLGVKAGYFFLKGRSIGQGFSSPGSPVLATPFFNALSGMPDSSLITYPGVLSGQVVVDAPSFLQGAEVNLAGAVMRTQHFRLEALAGFRYLNLNEGLNINATSLVGLAPQYVGLIPLDGNTITVNDSFNARNRFFGAQAGARAEIHHKRWTLEILAKIALGVSHEVVAIQGFSEIDTQPATRANAGLFAVGSNSGQFSRNVFAVVPEMGLTLKYQLTERLGIFGGYSFLYWSNVARPGDQVDTVVNPNLVPTSLTFGAAGGPSRPGFSFHASSFYAHGANFGVEFQY